jgi:hypothetical protein
MTTSLRRRGLAQSPPVSSRLTAFVAERLGLEAGEAAALLAAMSDRLGRRSFAIRTAAFAIALIARPLPSAVRRRALVAFLRPLLETPLALNTYAGRRLAVDPCAGLLRDG